MQCELYLLVGSLPKHCQDKDGCDRWGQVAGDGLDVNIQLTTVGILQDRDPDDAHYDKDNCH